MLLKFVLLFQNRIHIQLLIALIPITPYIYCIYLLIKLYLNRFNGAMKNQKINLITFRQNSMLCTVQNKIAKISNKLAYKMEGHDMDSIRWSLELPDNSRYSRWGMGRHFCFFDASLDLDFPNPQFTSPHLNVLGKDEEIRACARLESLFRLVNGLSLLTRGSPIYSRKRFFYHSDHNMIETWRKQDSTIFLEELNNPFEESVLKEIEIENEKRPIKNTVCTDYAELIVKDNLVREAVLLLTLSLEDELYLLVNAYKIYEIISNDMGFQKREGDEKGAAKKRKDEITEKYPFASFLDLEGLTGYINNKGASGFLCRHGHSNKETKITAPPYNEIVEIIIKAISEWLNYKCLMKFGRPYEPSTGRLGFYKDPDAWLSELDKDEIKFE